ncbi:MAG: TauD/TfdA family dioxygenase, partial [Gammaproteobacteria bacterium]
GGWHAEVSFYEEPAMGTILYAREVPRAGGDTLVANMILAYEALSDTMQNMLDGLVAIHSAERVYAPGGAYEGRANASSTGVNMSEDANRRVEHPVVRTHPETGQKSIYVDRAFTLNIKGLHQEESRMLLEFLLAHVTKTEYCTRIRWHENTLAFWDNRCTQHYALNDYPGERREMHRVVIEGDRPY